MIAAVEVGCLECGNETVLWGTAATEDEALALIPDDRHLDKGAAIRVAVGEVLTDDRRWHRNASAQVVLMDLG